MQYHIKLLGLLIDLQLLKIPQALIPGRVIIGRNNMYLWTIVGFLIMKIGYL